MQWIPCELLLSCRKGDVERIKYLIEQRDVDVNIRDKWDSTPLYYACLCGHIEAVKLLLDNGARCEANTFDGERCLYGALNQQIRSILNNYKVITKRTIRRQLYHEFLRKLLESGEYADICFVVHGKEFYAHRCILAARSDFFCEKFMNRWHDRAIVTINNEMVSILAFESILQYLYTGRIDLNFENEQDLIMLAKQCKLYHLVDSVETSSKKAHFIQSTKPGTCVTTMLIEPELDSCELQNDFGIMAEYALPIEFSKWIGASELPFYPTGRSSFSDIIFDVDGHKFLCHKAFFFVRSEYMKTVFRDPFNEQSSSCWDIPEIKLRNIKPKVFVDVLYYIYEDTVEDLNPDTVFDVLLAADMFLLPGLKRQCANLIVQYLDVDNVVIMLTHARTLQIPRLEDQCYEFMARNIRELCENDEFQALVVADAGMLKSRQETDTIDVVDNIRFHLTAANFDEAFEQLQLIDQLLEGLDLDG